VTIAGFGLIAPGQEAAERSSRSSAPVSRACAMRRRSAARLKVGVSRSGRAYAGLTRLDDDGLVRSREWPRKTPNSCAPPGATIAPDHRIENQRTIAPVEKSAIWSA
jgi:hypothetical protein